MPEGRSASRATTVCTGLVTAAMLVAIACSARLLLGELAVGRAERRLQTQLLAADAGQSISVPLQRPSLDLPPRALLADALLRARVAQGMPDSAVRRTLLADAATELTAIEGRRPLWGDAWSTSAFVAVLRDGPAAPAAHAALRRSYADAPYLRRAAGWRIAYGLRQWQALDGWTRSRILNEAVWLARSSTSSLDSVLALVRGTPAYAPFMVRWVANRRGDPDFQPS